MIYIQWFVFSSCIKLNPKMREHAHIPSLHREGQGEGLLVSDFFNYALLEK